MAYTADYTVIVYLFMFIEKEAKFVRPPQSRLKPPVPLSPFRLSLKVHKIENFFDSDFGICVISLLVMPKY